MQSQNFIIQQLFLLHVDCNTPPTRPPPTPGQPPLQLKSDSVVNSVTYGFRYTEFDQVAPLGGGVNEIHGG